MSLLFVDGFDHYATTDITKKWASRVGTSNAITAGGRFGGSFWRSTLAATSSQWLQQPFPAAASWVIGFAFRQSSIVSVGANTHIASLLDTGSIQCSLILNTDGTLSIKNGVSTALINGLSSTALANNTWYYIEWKMTIANSIGANTCKVRVNGVDWITVATGQDTQATANATANAVIIGHNSPGGGGNLWDWDDVYVCDQNGTLNNDFLGDVRVETLYPSGIGNSTNWTPSAGSNFACVDDVTPNDDTDYVSTALATTKDTYAYGNLATTPTSIKGVQITTLLRKSDAGSKTFAPVVRSGGTDYDLVSASVLDSYSFNTQMKETDPATSVAWTGAGVAAAEFGVKCVS